jgi:hypothetical protein
MLALTVNGQTKQVDAEGDAPLLWVIREHLQMTGTKFGCGAGLWGMSLALFEKAPLDQGALQVSNFNDYTPMRMSQMPDIDVSIISSNRRSRAAANPESRWWRPPSATRSSMRSAPGCARCRSLPRR